jgi:tetratricopeptide (TPR) repeat protein
MRWASTRAADRFDLTTAEALLDHSLELHADDETQLARARVRTLRGNYRAALEDVEACRRTGAAALEVGAWASYFGRDFEQATRYAADGVVAAEGVVRARCLMVGGRTRHAVGDLMSAETLLIEALDTATGVDRVVASAWLGVLRSHQSRMDEAISLLRPAASDITGFEEQTAATLHAVLFTGHAYALAGRPALALEQFDRYTAEVDRRQAPRFVGRGTNFKGWVLRNLGEPEMAAELHSAALDDANSTGTPELRIAALEDLAEDRHFAGDLVGAAEKLAEARRALEDGDLVFGWRLDMKLRMLRARLALDSASPGEALELANGLRNDAERSGVPRYASVAALLVHRARHDLGESVDLDAVDRDLLLAQRSIALEAWWWTGETGAALGLEAWVDRAESMAAALSRLAGPHEEALQKHAERRIAEWRLKSR